MRLLAFNTKLSAMKQLGFFIILSAVFHFLISTSTLYFAEKLNLDKKKYAVTQIEIINESQETLQQKIEKSRQLIKQLKASVKEIQDPMKNKNKKARFESEKTKRVEKETKSANLGISQNSLPKIWHHTSKKPESQKNGTENKTENIGLPEFARLKSDVQQMPVAQNSSLSTTLPHDISDSSATNLNTDANTYYSFYSRVEDLFYMRWVERIHYYWGRIDFVFKKNFLAGKIWTTTLEVWLTSAGEFHSAYIKQSSGYKPFDESAVFAFKDARYFPNPPKAKIEPDGFVRLRYRFSVHVPEY